MAAPTEIYVDPSIAADSGTGTIGDPYGDLQYALNTATRDSTNGNRFNIKAGTAEVLTGIISLATYGTPTADAPLIFEGYTSAAGDGGIGDLNGNNGNFTIVPNTNFQFYRNLKIRNTGTAAMITAALNWLTFDNVEFNTCTNATPLSVSTGCRFLNCNFNTFVTAGQVVLSVTGGGVVVYGCWFDVNGVLAALNIASGDSGQYTNNIINCAGVAIGIRINNVRGTVIRNNSILGSSGTGSGIALASAGADGAHIFNNIIAGFSGAGGDGIDVAAGSAIGIYGYNYFYNNTAHETGVSGEVFNSIGSNDTATASDPFARSGANTFANRFTYFAPNDVGSIQGGSYPSGCLLDIGAVQHADPAGGGGGGGPPANLSGGIFQ